MIGIVVELGEMFLRLVEGVARIREAARASWFNNSRGPDSLAFIEAAVPLEYGGGRGVYNSLGFLGELRKLGVEKGLYLYLPFVRLEGVVDGDVSNVYYSIVGGLVVSVPSDVEMVEGVSVELVEARLLKPKRLSQFLIDPLLSTRLQRLYDAASTVRDCRGGVTVLVNGIEARGYTLPAFIKCFVTGVLDDVLGEDEWRSLLEANAVSSSLVEAAKRGTYTLALIRKRGALLTRHALTLLSMIVGEELERREPAREDGAAAGI